MKNIFCLQRYDYIISENRLPIIEKVVCMFLIFDHEFCNMNKKREGRQLENWDL
jgi:hypothetical protein